MVKIGRIKIEQNVFQDEMKWSWKKMDLKLK